jgi:hypothetical protein
VYCLDATTGALVWNYTTDGEVISSPAVADGYVYVGSGWDMYCLNATTGALVWSYTTDYYVESSPAIAHGRVFVGSFDRKLYCLNATTGTFVWSYSTEDRIYSSPAVADGRVYVGSLDEKMYCLDATTGALVWNYTTDGEVISSPAVAGGYVYVGSGWDMYCLNAATGDLAWLFEQHGNVDSSPAVTGGCVYVGSDDGKVYCMPMIFTPSITHPADINHIMWIGSDAIYWTIKDTTPGKRSYSIYCNGVPVSNGSWYSGGTDGFATIQINDLFIGIYNYTIIAIDGQGRSIQDTVFVFIYINPYPLIPIVTILIVLLVLAIMKKRRDTRSVGVHHGKTTAHETGLIHPKARISSLTLTTRAKSPTMATVPVQNVVHSTGTRFLDRMATIVKTSDHLTVTQLAMALGVSEKFIWKHIFDWAEQFKFKIKGDMVVFKDIDTQEFADKLDAQFKEWESNERQGDGKT